MSALPPIPPTAPTAGAPAPGGRIGLPSADRHPLLRRQLARLGLEGAAPSPALWEALLDDVSAAYADADARPGGLLAEVEPGQNAAPSAEQTKLSAVIGSLGEGLLVLDDELRVESINRQGEQILRTSAQAMIGRPFDELATSWSLRDRGPYAVSKMRHHLLRGIPYRNDDAFVVSDDGSIIHVSLVMTPTESDGQRLGAVICFRDVTTLKMTERRLRESERRFRRIFNGAPTGMVRIAPDGTVTESNAAFQDLLRLDGEALAGAHLARLSHPEDADVARRQLAVLFEAPEDTSWEGEWRFMRADGQTVWTNTSLARVGSGEDDESFAIAVVEDETERKRLEVELRHAQKLESVGRLAAGIAHEINTPIQFIGDNVHFIGEAFDTLRRAADAEPPETAEADLQFLVDEVPVAVQQTLDGIERVAGIVRAMKSFGRPDPGQRSPADLNEAVRSTIVVARNELKYVADVETDLGDLPSVPCFIGDVNQVLLNLLINAAHAIEEVVGGSTSRGTITVTTRCRGEGVEVAVTDTGAGVPEGIRHRLFDPFFTSKGVGKGTGQGLALARRIIVERHGGELTFDTELGSGTTFRIWLPLSPS